MSMSIRTLQGALGLPHIRSYVDDSKKYVYQSEQRTLLRKMAARLLTSGDRDRITTLDYERLRVALNQMLNIGELAHKAGSQIFDKAEVKPLETNAFRPSVIHYCNKVLEESMPKLAEFKAGKAFQPGDMVISKEGILYKAIEAGTTEEIGVVKKPPEFRFVKEEVYGDTPILAKGGVYVMAIRGDRPEISVSPPQGRVLKGYGTPGIKICGDMGLELEGDKYGPYNWANKHCNVSLQDFYTNMLGEPYQEQMLQKCRSTGLSSMTVTLEQLQYLLASAPSKEVRDELKRQFYVAMYSGDPLQYATQTVNLTKLKGETTMKPITLTTKTYIDNGEQMPLEDMPKDKVYDLIKSHEAKIESLEKIKSKPAALKAEIEAYQKGIDTLVQWLDANKKP